MDQKTLQFYFDKSKKAKDQVKSVYNEVLEFTDSTYQIVDSATKDFQPKEIDSVIPIALDDLVSFLMTSMFNRSSKWATLKMNEKLYKLVSGDMEEYLVGSEIDKLNKQLENTSDVVFTYLNQSNYYTEIAKALREAVNLGVGCYRITETTNAYTPFTFQYVPLDDLYYWVDSLGRPNYVFKVLRDMSEVAINLMFKGECKIPSKLKNPDEDSETLMEIVVPAEEDGKFTYMITDESFKEVLLEKEIDYNPITIFRWSLEGSNPWGLGLSLKGLKCFKELKDLKDKRKASAEKLLDPPLFLSGDKSLAMSLSLEAKAINYAGNRTNTGLGMNTEIGVTPIQTVGTLLPLDQDIAEKYNEIRQLYISNPLGNVADTTRRTKTEVEMRLQSLRQKWGLSYELLAQELLTPAFITPFKILVNQKKIEFEMANFDATMINYRNALSLSQDVQSVEMIIMYMQQAVAVAQNAEQVGLNSTKTLTYFQDNLGVPQDLRLTEEEQTALRERLMQQQEAIASSRFQQQMENAGNETGGAEGQPMM